jgi:hypothetical protein
MRGDERAVAQAMRETLVAGMSAGGGWGYYPGHAARLEPTCWALLALGSRESHREFFQASMRSDGLLLEPALREEDRPNLAFNGLAALLFADQKDVAPDGSLDRLTAGVIAHRGIKLPQSNLSPQDNSLQAWAWIDTTFSWVEPTGWCTLALKKAAPNRAAARSRIDEAERLLRDRCCTTGGWNSGTAMVLGQGLNPYVPTTALGLMALQNLPHDAVVVRSLEELRRLRLSERSAMALSLTLIAFSLFGLDTVELEDALIGQWSRTRFLGNLHLTAMALYSLTHREHGTAAFRL